MERLGDLDTEMMQDLAEAVARKFRYTVAEGLDNGLRILTKTEKFKKEVRIIDHGKTVFDAVKYADGDQIVSACTFGSWRRRLAACA